MSAHPYRSALYMPASNARALAKARTLDVDAIIFDLEDAVAPDQKVVARTQLSDDLAQGGHGTRARIVRINALSSQWGEADARAVADMNCDGVLLPKVDGAHDIDALAALIPDLPIWAMIETPRAILNAAAIADHPRVAGFVMGTNDLVKDLGLRVNAGREALQYALQSTLIAARAAGIIAIDGVYNAFKDEAGLRAECEQGRDFGFDGKSLIHPAQITVTNAIFSPSDIEIALAHAQIEAYNSAIAQGRGVAVLDGKIVENLHVETARATLAKAHSIAGN